MITSHKFVQIVASIGVATALILSVAPASSMASQGQANETNPSAGAAHLAGWSGYAATGGTFTKVQGSIKVPKATCTENAAQAVFWVGMDGYQSAPVEQSGIGVKCVGQNLRTPSYYAFWEMYPTNNIQTMPLKVVPGDLVTSTVTYAKSSSKFWMEVQNNTRHTSYVVSAKCGRGQTCSRNSAEWIAERPTKNGAYVGMAKWGTVALYGNTAAEGGNLKPISAYTNNAVDMYTTRNKLLAAVGKLTPNGKSFTDYWKAAN